MDRKNKKNLVCCIALSVTVLALIVLVSITLFIFRANDGNFASASEAVVQTKSITCVYLEIVNGKSVTLNRTDYVSGYRGNIKAEFIVGAEYYAFGYRIDDGPLRMSALAETPADGVVTFNATETGRYVLTCYAYDDMGETTVLGSETVNFSNDASKPYLSGTAIAEMNTWKRTGQNYTVYADWSQYADLGSGIAGISYWLEYGDNTETEAVSVDLLKTNGTVAIANIDRACIVKVLCFDHAGNGEILSYPMDKFDDEAPPAPTYKIIPELDSGIYSNTFEIEVTFLEDNGKSGLSNVQYYIISEMIVGSTGAMEVKEVKKQFEADLPTPERIVLTTAMDYTVRLYAIDKAGNISPECVINIPSSVFDVLPPVVNGCVKTIDITNTKGICRMGIYASDGSAGGIAEIKTEDGIIIFERGVEDDYYVAEFDCFGANLTMSISIVDKAGNQNKYITTFPYFSDAEISLAVQKCVNQLRNTDLNKYANTAMLDIKAAINKLNGLLSAENSQKVEIVRAAETLQNLLQKVVNYTYVIENAPDIASANLTFEFEDDDFVGYKKGENLVMTLTSWSGNGNDYSSLAGFSNSFNDYFVIEIAIAGEEGEDKPLDNPLQTGVLVGMNKPVAYYDRDVVIVNAATGDIVPSEVKNNRIFFRVKKDTEFILVIDGGKAATGTQDEKKTITVFRNELPLGTFLGVVCGCSGAAIVAVAVLIILKKIRG